MCKNSGCACVTAMNTTRSTPGRGRCSQGSPPRKIESQSQCYRCNQVAMGGNSQACGCTEPHDVHAMRVKREQVTHVSTFAGIIFASSAASITDCHEFVVSGGTKPNAKNHSVKYRSRKTSDTPSWQTNCRAPDPHNTHNHSHTHVKSRAHTCTNIRARDHQPTFQRLAFE